MLPLMSQYTLFQLNNRDHCLTDSEIHNLNTRHSSILHLPLTNFHIYQRGNSCIKIFNSLPFNINKTSDNPKTF